MRVLDEATDIDVEHGQIAERCGYCGKPGATEAHDGDMFHGRCLSLILLHKIPRERFLARKP